MEGSRLTDAEVSCCSGNVWAGGHLENKADLGVSNGGTGKFKRTRICGAAVDKREPLADAADVDHAEAAEARRRGSGIAHA